MKQIFLFVTVIAGTAMAETTPSPRPRGRPLPASLSDVPMTPQLKEGLRVLETEYYHSKQVYPMLSYSLAVLAKLDKCLSKSPGVTGKVRVEIQLVRVKDRLELEAGRYRMTESTIAPRDEVAVGACLQVALEGTRQEIVGSQVAKGSVYRTAFTFPVENDPIYRFLATGDYKLIVGNAPPVGLGAAPKEELLKR